MRPSRPRLSWQAVVTACIVMACGAVSVVGQRPKGGSPNAGWTIPPEAATAKFEGRVSPPVVRYGRTLYRRHCQRCHGPTGRGDGTEADPKFPPGDLTDRARAAENPDGIMFYKIWYGRTIPPMPAYKDQLTREEAWALVHYLKTLRK